MSSVSVITSTQLPTFASRTKNTAQHTFQQTLATAQSAPAINQSSATISQAARDALATTVVNATHPSTGGSAIPADSEPAFKQAMAEKFAGRNRQKAMAQADPSNPEWAKNVDFYAHHDFTAGSDVLYDISHTMPGASGNPRIDGILRYSSGETVTAESQAYATRQTAVYQNQLREMISAEKGKGASAGEIWIKIMDLQEQQPARYRAMTAWPNAADFANNK